MSKRFFKLLPVSVTAAILNAGCGQGLPLEAAQEVVKRCVDVGGIPVMRETEGPGYRGYSVTCSGAVDRNKSLLKAHRQ